MKSTRIGIVVLMLLFSGCHIGERFVSAERKAKWQQSRTEREHARQYQKAKDRHISMQSQNTLRNMRQNRQKSEQWLRSMRKPPFFVRWFQSNNNKR